VLDLPKSWQNATKGQSDGGRLCAGQKCWICTNPVKKNTPNNPVVSDLHEPDCPVISNLKSKVRPSFIELLDKYKKHEAIQKKRDCPIKKKERPTTEHKRRAGSSITT